MSFQCDRCENGFTRKDNLTIHYKVHDQNQAPFITEPAVLSENKEDCANLRHPFTMIVAGVTGSGKTVWVQKLLTHAQETIKPAPQMIEWYYSQWQSAYEQMQRSIPNITFIKGIPYNIEEDSYFDPRQT